MSENRRRGNMLLKAMNEVYPNLRVPEDAEHWCGLRPITPDDRPILGPTRLRNLIMNTGHGNLGSSLACATGQMVADHILGQISRIPFEGLTLDR